MERIIIKRKEKVSNYKFIIWIYGLMILTGAINIYSIKILGTPITHHTGNASAIAINLYEKMYIPLELLILMGSFFAGSVISGLLYYDKVRRPKKRYGLSLVMGGVILIVIETFDIRQFEVSYLAFLVGIQNAMFIKYRGAFIRTSHITGYLTDAGFALGAYLRGKKTELWKAVFYLFSIIVFILGGVLGYFLIETIESPLIVIGFMYIFAGAYYFYLRKYNA